MDVSPTSDTCMIPESEPVALFMFARSAVFLLPTEIIYLIFFSIPKRFYVRLLGANDAIIVGASGEDNEKNFVEAELRLITKIRSTLLESRRITE